MWFLFLLFPLLVYAKSPCPYECRPQNATEKFFDIDKNKELNWYERSLIYTQSRFGWEMADTDLKKKFDDNRDWMLEPEEQARYQKSLPPINKRKIPVKF